MRTPLVVFAILTILSVAALAQSTLDWENPPMRSFSQALIDDGIAPERASAFEKLLNQQAKKYGVPVDVLFASIYQESDFQHYGVNLDYGNYSCGISQYNISGWCQTINRSRAQRDAFEWPSGLNCNKVEDLNQKIMGPFLTAIQAAHELPPSGTEPNDFMKLDASLLTSQMPGRTRDEQAKYYQAAMSFGRNCSTPQLGVISMAKTLKQIMHDYVPKELKQAHPHTAYLVADAIYNIGPVLTDIIKQNSGPDVWSTLTPQKIIAIEGAIWAKRPANATTETTFDIVDSDGETQHVKYFQACVNQRHIANIIKASLPDQFNGLISSTTDECGQ